MFGPRPLVSETFEIPLRVETNEFVLCPLTIERFHLDYESYMSSVEHLQRTFDLEPKRMVLNGDTDVWPANSDLEFAVLDAAWCHFEWKIWRSSFTYTALSKNETIQLGCGYIFPSHKMGYDVLCQTWVRADQLERGFDTEFYEWFRSWVEDEWPFDGKSIAWPGRELPWEEWNAIADKEGTVVKKG